MSLTGMLLRGFGPTTSGGATPPAEPALSIVGNGNGVDALATITGSTAGASNVVQVQLTTQAGWANAGSRSGDGTITLTLSRGNYWGRVRSTKNGLTSYSDLAYFAITSPPNDAGCSPLGQANISNLMTGRAGICPSR